MFQKITHVLLLSLGSVACASAPIPSNASFASTARNPDFLITAPHGGFDLNSDDIAEAIADELNWSIVIADGFRKRIHPINVNRPTEGLKLANEESTPRAREVFDRFQNEVMKVSRGVENTKLYIEIHGEAGEGKRIEVATVGLSQEQAAHLKRLFQQQLSAQRFKDLEVEIEGVDEIRLGARSAKRLGLLGRAKTALHIELSRPLRFDEREATVRLLSATLKQIPSALELDTDATQKTNP